MHVPPLQKTPGGYQCAEKVAALVGAGGQVRGQSCQQIGGQGDQPPAAGHRVDQSAQKDQRTDNDPDADQLVPFHVHLSCSRPVAA